MAHINLFCAIKSVLISSWWLPLETWLRLEPRAGWNSPVLLAFEYDVSNHNTPRESQEVGQRCRQLISIPTSMPTLYRPRLNPDVGLLTTHLRHVTLQKPERCLGNQPRKRSSLYCQPVDAFKLPKRPKRPSPSQDLLPQCLPPSQRPPKATIHAVNPQSTTSPLHRKRPMPGYTKQTSRTC